MRAMADRKTEEMLVDISSYYSAKISEFGATAKGVDWNGDASQRVRFEQIAKIMVSGKSVSVNDLGCGYGALLEFLYERYEDVDYTGVDVSPSMIAAAKAKYPRDTRIKLFVAAEPPQTADYGVASGIFNVRLSHDVKEWDSYVETTLET